MTTARIYPPGVSLGRVNTSPVFGDSRLPPRFWKRVSLQGECWVWTGAMCVPKGYGTISWRGKTKKTHRVAYTALVGTVPPWLTVDHLCRVRACCNPLHLEPVYGRINCLRGFGPTAENARKTHCPRGHAYEGGNIIWATEKGKVSGRKCRTCERKRLADINRIRRAEEKAARHAAKAAAR